MGAPIEYSAEHNGFFYTDDTFVLPSYLISQEEKRALSYLAYHYGQAGEPLSARLVEFFSRVSGGAWTRPDGRPEVPVFELDPSEVPLFESLRRAIRDKCKVEIAYLKGGSLPTARRFCPYKLFAKGQVHYVVGFCELRQAIRVFRLSRIQGLRETKEPFQVLPTFDERAYGESVPFSITDPYVAVVRFSGPIDSRALKMNAVLVEKDTYRLEFRSSQDALSALLSLPVGFSILKPNWLRERLRARLEQIAESNRG
jgi:predicted DNA-binding transcriptional regulator YafY